MEKYYSTQNTAKILKVQPDRIQKAIWNGRLESPLKSHSGNYLWTKQDIERVAWALHRWNEFKVWESRSNGE